MYRRLIATLAIAFTAPALTLTIPACTSTERLNDLPADPGPSFVLPDSATPILEAGLIEYCPSSDCPTGYTSCPTSAFRCDVNLLTDTRNCGACGVACPASGTAERYSCIEGKCVLACDPQANHLDCNDIVDDGCETSIGTNENCGGCGLTCLDPSKPCVDRTGTGSFGCGCLGDNVVCMDSNGPTCQDVRYNDLHCGACENACDPFNGGDTLPDQAYYGCHERQCGSLKCAQYFGDCDHDPATNGCEAPLWTQENCGGCGKTCPADQFCAFQLIGTQLVLGCVCPQGLSFCGQRSTSPFEPSAGGCYDLTSDIDYCGSCEVACPGKNSWLHATPSCEYGACKLVCMAGWGDCNGNAEDDCETHTDNDPKNCGGCGIACDAVAGQACVQGHCVVAPCEKDGGLPR